MSVLPEYVEPMLAKPGDPFDSDEHLFEVKWDGTRAVVYVEDGQRRIMNRRRRDITEHYPEFEFLDELPDGTVLDGEVVVLDAAGKPDFRSLQVREQAQSPIKFRTLAQATPATYIVFDQLYDRFQSLITQPLRTRREHLEATTRLCESDRVVVSQGIVGAGRRFHKQVLERDLEGTVAKRLGSRYLPGKRTDAWIKIKKRSEILCAIIGYIPKGEDFESLVIASDEDGELRCVGKVGTGFDAVTRNRLNDLLRSRQTDQPLVPCRDKAIWIVPGLYARVRFLEKTRGGDLRDPVCEQVIVDD
jgi:DNA ligase D-like protein (predicted ligase)